MRIEESVDVAATPGELWERVCDPCALTRLSEDLRVSADDGTEEPGLRARYRVLLHVGGAQIGADVEITEWTPPRELAWTSIRGVDHRFRLRIRGLGDGRSRVTVRFGYSSPGLLGGIADAAAYGQVAAELRRLLERVKADAEGVAPEPEGGPSLVGRVLHEAVNVGILARSGIVAPMRPDKIARMGLAALTWGPTIAAGVAAGAIRHPDAPMIIDEAGELTWAEVDRRSSAIAVGLAEIAGAGEGDTVGVMCRNHRGFVEAVTAVAKLGADVLLLNTAFAGPQLRDVCKREGPVALVLDEEFKDLLGAAGRGRRRILAWRESERARLPSLDDLAEEHMGRRPSSPDRHGRLTILTSGTTGTPKGASRGLDSSGRLPTLDAPAGLLGAIPMRAGDRMMVAAPLFHAWGLGNLGLGLGLGATFVLRRKFDPAGTLEDIERHRCEILAAVPVMLQRILELPAEERARYDTSALRVVAVSGSAVSAELATRWMDAFGDNLYNLYGSTEVASATIATPEDMRRAPGTAGRPPRGIVVKILDEHGAEVLQGRTGRIFVGSSMVFEGYTGGGDKNRVGGLVATGDIGRFDAAGRLFVEGRDDEMIVSGGENVFPKEVEDTLAEHPAVAEAACVGVEDEDFGQRLQAFVVRDGDASEKELKGWVRDRLARYKVPREVVFVDELPRNATGKILKRELKAND